jgi:hypothetical protein
VWKPFVLGHVQILVFWFDDFSAHSRIPLLTGSNNVELHFEPAFDDDLSDHPSRRLLRKILFVDAIEDIVFETAIDKSVHLYQPMEAGAISLEKDPEILEDAMGLARNGPVLALSGRRVNGNHA